MNKKKARQLRRAASLMIRGKPTKQQMKRMKKEWDKLNWKEKTNVTQTGNPNRKGK